MPTETTTDPRLALRPALTLPAHVVHASGEAKTVCTSAVLAHFGICPSTYHYSGKAGQLETILRRNGWAVRSRLSTVGKNKTIGAVRAKVAKIGEAGVFYFAHVPGHAMLLDEDGRTVVDTAPRTRDRRRVLRIFAVYRA